MCTCYAPHTRTNMLDTMTQTVSKIDVDALQQQVEQEILNSGPEPVEGRQRRLLRRLEEAKAEVERLRTAARDEAVDLICTYTNADRHGAEVERAVQHTLSGSQSDLYWRARWVAEDAADATDCRVDVDAALRKYQSAERKRRNIRRALEAIDAALERYDLRQLMPHKKVPATKVNVEADDQLSRTLTNDTKRLRWIGDVLMARGSTWAERYAYLGQECARLNIDMPYNDVRSLESSYNRYLKRNVK